MKPTTKDLIYSYSLRRKCFPKGCDSRKKFAKADRKEKKFCGRISTRDSQIKAIPVRERMWEHGGVHDEPVTAELRAKAQTLSARIEEVAINELGLSPKIAKALRKKAADAYINANL